LKLIYYAVNKPYGVLTQFTDKEGRKTLADLFKFPANVYPVGRLDMDSEGLLILTNDKRLTDHLLNPVKKHEREYYVQVEGSPAEADLQKLRDGVIIGNRKTLPAKVKKITPPNFRERVPPVRFRKTVLDSWLSITLVEGRNRQVRKMTAKIGFPTLRLVRVRINSLHLNNLPVGKVRELSAKEIDNLFKK